MAGSERQTTAFAESARQWTSGVGATPCLFAIAQRRPLSLFAKAQGLSSNGSDFRLIAFETAAERGVEELPAGEWDYIEIGITPLVRSGVAIVLRTLQRVRAGAVCAAREDHSARAPAGVALRARPRRVGRGALGGPRLGAASPKMAPLPMSRLAMGLSSVVTGRADMARR